MKKVIQKLFLIISLSSILCVLTACASTTTATPSPNPDSNNDAARIIEALVLDLAGQTNLSLKAEGADGEGILVNGTIDAEGNIKLELPITLDASFIGDFEPNPGCDFNPASDAQAFFLETLTVYEADQLVGELIQENATSEIVRVFVTEDTNIECTNPAENASFKKGWNLVAFNKTTDIGQVIASSDAPWTFEAEPSQPSPDPDPTPDPTPTPDPDPTPEPLGALELIIEGLAEGVDANITVTGPNNFNQIITSSTTLANLSSGTYRFTINSVKPDAATFSDNGSPTNLEFDAVKGASITLSYACSLVSPPDANLDAALKDIFGKVTYNCVDLATASTLDLSNKGIKNIEGIQYAIGLSNLSLRANEIDSLPAGIFDNLTELTSLNLGANQLASLPEGVFDKLIVLSFLDVVSNQLTSLPDGLFANLTAITQINLNGNPLGRLEAGLFDGLTVLRQLGLVNIQLTSIEEGLFDDLTALTFINFTLNQLESLPEGLFKNSTRLGTLDVSRNCLTPTSISVESLLVDLGERVSNLNTADNPRTDVACPENTIPLWEDFTGDTSQAFIAGGSTTTTPATNFFLCRAGIDGKKYSGTLQIFAGSGGRCEIGANDTGTILATGFEVLNLVDGNDRGLEFEPLATEANPRVFGGSEGIDICRVVEVNTKIPGQFENGVCTLGAGTFTFIEQNPAKIEVLTFAKP